MNYTEASDRIKQIAFHYQGILELADALNEAGSLEATIAGLRKLKAEDDAALETVHTSLVHAQAEVTAANEAAAQVVEQAHQQAAEIVAVANADAAEARATAAQDAARILQAERDSREETLAHVTEAIRSAQLSLADLQSQATAAMGAQQEAMKKLTETTAELAVIQDRARKMASGV
jgi:chromosome segregation ATPase